MYRVNFLFRLGTRSYKNTRSSSDLDTFKFSKNICLIIKNEKGRSYLKNRSFYCTGSFLSGTKNLKGSKIRSSSVQEYQKSEFEFMHNLSIKIE